MRSLHLSKIWSMVLLVSMAISTLSCGNEESATPELPNMQVIKCSAGDRKDLVFTANSNWRLSSDAVWCKFQTSGGNLQDISGRAGTHQIKLEISNEQIKDRVTTANITIIMGSNKAIIARVERDPDKFDFKVYDITGTPTNGVINISYRDYTPVLIWANFDYASVEFPEWVEILGETIVGVANEQTEAYLRIVPNGERERYPITKEDGYEIVFSSEDGKPEKTFRCAIVYNGMGEDVIAINGPTTDEFGWEVSADGKSFSQLNAEGEVVTFENELIYNIIAHKDIYDMVFVENVIERGIPSYMVYLDDVTDDDYVNCWMHFDKERMAFTVDATDRQRHGFVMALPHGVYENLGEDLKTGVLFEMDNSSGIELPVLKNKFLQYVVASFTQRGSVEADPATQMHIYHSLTAYEIPAMPYTDSAVLAQYGVEEAYIAPFINSIADRQPCIVINPRVEGWTTENHEAGNVGVEVWYKGEQLKMSDKEYYIGENVDELLSLQLYGPKSGFAIGRENIYIVFKVENEAKKLLVVTPPVK